jgi:hypothetical protein
MARIYDFYSVYTEVCIDRSSAVAGVDKWEENKVEKYIKSKGMLRGVLRCPFPKLSRSVAF